MRNVLDYAKYFMKNATGLDKSFDGNMKLQKLLVFSNLVNMAPPILAATDISFISFVKIFDLFESTLFFRACILCHLL